MVSIRVLDRARLGRICAGAAVILAVAGLGTLTWDGPMGTMLRYTVAPSCPADAPSADCVATLPATVVSSWTDYGEGEPHETVLGLDVPGATRNQSDGGIDTSVSLADAERLRVEQWAVPDPVDRVEVRMFDGEVVEVTGASGETAVTRYGLLPRLAAVELLLMVLVASAVVACVIALLQRRCGLRSPSWLGSAVVTATFGAVAGLVVTVATNGHVTERWTVPVLGAAVLVVAAPVAALSARRLREPFATPPQPGHLVTVDP